MNLQRSQRWKTRRMGCPESRRICIKGVISSIKYCWEVRTQKCALDLATLLSLRGGLPSSSYSVKDTNRGKDRIARTRIQDWRKAGICVGVEETSSECKEPSWHHEGSKPLLNWREPCKKNKFQKDQTPSKGVRLLSLSFEPGQRRHCSSSRLCPLGWLLEGPAHRLSSM